MRIVRFWWGKAGSEQWIQTYPRITSSAGFGSARPGPPIGNSEDDMVTTEYPGDAKAFNWMVMVYECLKVESH